MYYLMASTRGRMEAVDRNREGVTTRSERSEGALIEEHVGKILAEMSAAYEKYGALSDDELDAVWDSELEHEFSTRPENESIRVSWPQRSIRPPGLSVHELYEKLHRATKAMSLESAKKARRLLGASLFPMPGSTNRFDIDGRIIERIVEAVSADVLQETRERPIEAVLGQLALVLHEAASLQEKTQALVDEARGKGATWVQIGAVAGVRPQSAYQRWTETGREKNREHQRRRREST